MHIDKCLILIFCLMLTYLFYRECFCPFPQDAILLVLVAIALEIVLITNV